jgi:hypothetical protein
VHYDARPPPVFARYSTRGNYLREPFSTASCCKKSSSTQAEKSTIACDSNRSEIRAQATQLSAWHVGQTTFRSGKRRWTWRGMQGGQKTHLAKPQNVPGIAAAAATVGRRQLVEQLAEGPTLLHRLPAVVGGAA